MNVGRPSGALVIALVVLLLVFLQYGILLSSHSRSLSTFNDDLAVDRPPNLLGEHVVSEPTQAFAPIHPDEQPLNSTKLVYVHIGKTGGITLDLVLKSNCKWRTQARQKLTCLQMQQGIGPESKLSEATSITIHTSKLNGRKRQMKSITGFLVTARNPLTRFHSSFYMNHPDNPSSGPSYAHSQNLSGAPFLFYRQCFPLIEDIATLLQMGSNGTTLTGPQQACKAMGIAAILGNPFMQACGHCGMNYRFYNQGVIARHPGRDIWVIRTEYLWDDVSRIDQLLGGSGNFSMVAGARHTHNSEAHTVNTALSESGMQTVCCYLAGEIQLYQDWIVGAVNLFPSEKEEAVNLVFRQCGAVNTNTDDRQLPSPSSTFSWIEWAEKSPQCLPYGINATMLVHYS